jgi:tetraacyldisaccharide 4'-kinase
MLQHLGATVMGERRFADHHAFSDRDAAQLMTEAGRIGARLVTTEKDFVRLRRTGAQADLKQTSRPVPIVLQVRDGDGAILMARIADVIKRRKD